MFSLSKPFTSPDLEYKPYATNLSIGKAGSGENVSNSQAIAQVTPELAVPVACDVQDDDALNCRYDFEFEGALFPRLQIVA